MLFSHLLISALGATVLAAPTAPELNMATANAGSIGALSDYFSLLAQKVQESRGAAVPTCDLSQAQMSIDSASPLPPPSVGLTLRHVAIGRGTQNYTCDPNNATAPPTQVGALAALFNASCVAASYPDLLNALPRAALQFNLTQGEAEPTYYSASTVLAPTTVLGLSGHHYFRNATTPFFDLDTPAMDLGQAPSLKNNTSAAPADAPTGQQGESAVTWLKLLAREGTSGNLQEMYRIQTAGGNSPATCEGMPASFEVQYAAQYWFYEGQANNLKWAS